MVNWRKLKKGNVVTLEEIDEKGQPMKKKYRVKEIKKIAGGGRVIYMVEQKR